MAYLLKTPGLRFVREQDLGSGPGADEKFRVPVVFERFEAVPAAKGTKNGFLACFLEQF